MKRITNAEALKRVRLRNEFVGNQCDSHADDTDDNQNHIERKDVRNSQRKAKDNTQYTRPVCFVRPIALYTGLIFGE